MGRGGEDMHDSSEDWRECSSLRFKYPGPFFLACNVLSLSDVPVVVIIIIFFFGGEGVVRICMTHQKIGKSGAVSGSGIQVLFSQSVTISSHAILTVQ